MRKTARGATIVEFAIVAPVLLLLILAVVELGILLWANLTMQYAVREGARYAITGQSNLDPNTSNPQRYLAVIQKIKNSSMGLYDRVHPTITIDNGASASYSDPSQYNPGMFGGPGDIVVIQLNCVWPILTPLLKPFFPQGQYSFSVAATMRNEAFQ